MRVDYRVTLPAAVHALRKLDDVARAVPLEPRLLELVRLRASQLNGCPHCVELHTNTARSLGEDERRLTLLSVWQTSSVFSQREQAALRWCEALTQLTTSTSDEFDELSAHFEADEIVGLTFAIIAINSWNRLRVGLDGPEPVQEHVDLRVSTDAPADARTLQLAAHLQRLEDEIAQVREDYRRAIAGPPSPHYYESGTVHPELDDQSIAP